MEVGPAALVDIPAGRDEGPKLRVPLFGDTLREREIGTEREREREVRAGVERGLNNGELRALDNVASIAHTVWAAVHGVTTLMLDHADTYGYHRDLHLQAEKSMRMMIAGLCTDPSFIANLPSEATPYPPEQ